MAESSARPSTVGTPKGGFLRVLFGIPGGVMLMGLVGLVLALLITGTAFGLMRIVTGAAVPVPTTLLALAVTVKSPLCVGVPTIWPAPLTDKPSGSPVAP